MSSAAESPEIPGESSGNPLRLRGVVPLARQIAFVAVTLGTTIAASLLLRPHVAATNLAMLYLLGVVGVAMRCGRMVSVTASFLSVAAFDFFCVPPYLTLRVHEYEYLLTFAGMLAVALVISTLTVRIRKQAADAEDREARTETLYRLSRRLAGQQRVFDVACTAAQFIDEVFPAKVVIFLPEEGRVNFQRRSSDYLPVPRTDEAVAQGVFERGQKAESESAIYLPLRGAKERVGVMAVIGGESKFSAEQVWLLELFAGQTALAIERTLSHHAAEDARVRMQTEEMRSSLLSAVSHDLRTPLASITGAATTLRTQGDRLDSDVRGELLESIADEAERLGRLVSNLLDMTRLESGVDLRRDLYPLEEIVGAALQRMERRVRKHRVTTDLPESLPMVYADDVLLGQVVANLLENAIKYTPEGTPIEIAAESSEDAIILEVRDRGPGVPEGEEQRIFEKFYRKRTKGVGGAGLGLAICRAIVEAHRGTIEARHRAGGGALFRVRLPLVKPP